MNIACVETVDGESVAVEFFWDTKDFRLDLEMDGWMMGSFRGLCDMKRLSDGLADRRAIEHDQLSLYCLVEDEERDHDGTMHARLDDLSEIEDLEDREEDSRVVVLTFRATYEYDDMELHKAVLPEPDFERLREAVGVCVRTCEILEGSEEYRTLKQGYEDARTRMLEEFAEVIRREAVRQGPGLFAEAVL